jgi:hypothetical protein
VLPWWEGADEAQSRCSFSAPKLRIYKLLYKDLWRTSESAKEPNCFAPHEGFALVGSLASAGRNRHAAPSARRALRRAAPYAAPGGRECRRGEPAPAPRRPERRHPPRSAPRPVAAARSAAAAAARSSGGRRRSWRQLRRTRYRRCASRVCRRPPRRALVRRLGIAGAGGGAQRVTRARKRGGTTACRRWRHGGGRHCVRAPQGRPTRARLGTLQAHGRRAAWLGASRQLVYM